MNDIVFGKPGPLSVLELVGLLALFVTAAWLVARLDAWIAKRFPAWRARDKDNDQR